MRFSFFLFLLLLLFFTTKSTGQKLDCSYRNYTIKDGLPANLIFDLSEDKDGYVWIATSGGLSRFDGKNFVNFDNLTNPDFFEDNYIYSIYEFGEKLLLLSRKFGLIEFDPKTAASRRIHKTGVSSVHHKGDTFVTMYTNGLLEVKIKNVIRSSKVFKNLFESHVAIYNNNIYFNDFLKGIYQLDINTLETVKIFKDDKVFDDYDVYPSKQFGIVFKIKDKAFILDENKELQEHPLIEHPGILTHYAENYKKQISYIYSSKHVNVRDEIKFQKFREFNLPNVELKSVLKLSENTTLIGSNQGFIIENANLEKGTYLDDNINFDANTIRVRRKIIENDGILYLLGFPGILEYNQKSKKYKSVYDKFKPFGIYDAVLHKSVIYCSSEGNSLMSYDIKKQKIEKKLIENEDFSSLYHVSVLNDSTLIIGAVGNILIYNIFTKKYVVSGIGKGLYVYDIVYNPFQKKYLAATDIGILCFDINKNNKIDYSRIISTKTSVKDLLIEVDKKQLWLATDEGIELRDLNNLSLIKNFKNSVTISNKRVTALIMDNADRIWASTFSGVTVIDQKNDKIYFLNQINGLKNEEYNYKSALKLNNGQIIFGGIKMYDFIDESILESKNYIQKFKITGISKSYPNQKETFFTSYFIKNNKLSFNTGKEDLNIFISNFDFTENSVYRFEYQIDNDKWIKIENGTFRISNIPYGVHSLKIRMYNPIGAITETQIFQLDAIIPPYKTNSFLFLLIAIISVLFLILFINIIKSRQIELQTKSRIAMDLHDEAGTILTRLLMITQSRSNISENREQINSGLNNALFSIRAFIGSLSENKINMNAFEDDIKEFVQKSFQNTNIRHSIIFNYGLNFYFKSELYRDIKLSIYEALTNIIKHSKCNSVNISVKVEAKKIKIEILEDVTVEDVNAFFNKGNGINNMIKRAERHQGTFQYKNDENGLKLEMTFKIV